MPFLTEELWHQLPQKAGAKSIALDQFPETQSRWKNAEAQKNVALIQEVITALRTIRAELKLDPKKRVQADFSTGDAAASNLIETNLSAITRFAVLSELRIAPRQTFQARTEAQRSTALYDVRIAYSDTVDVAAEKIRLKKETEGLQKAVASKERQLGDDTFRSRAPEGLEATLAEQRIELKKLQDRLAQL